MSPEKMWELMREAERLNKEGKHSQAQEKFEQSVGTFSEWLSSDDQDGGEDE